jgi:Zn-finger nucleic acid-binding protein
MYRPRTREVDIDRCLQCDVAWFDAGELETWRARSRLPVGRSPPRFVAAADGAALRCPACESDTLQRGRSRNETLHRCERCGGFLAHYRPGEGLERALENLLGLYVG